MSNKNNLMKTDGRDSKEERMFNQLWKWLGYHVCEEFTQWEKVTATVVVTPYIGKLPVLKMQHEATRTWQERRCTLCGKIYKEKL